jgi:hypothetical protein
VSRIFRTLEVRVVTAVRAVSNERQKIVTGATPLQTGGRHAGLSTLARGEPHRTSSRSPAPAPGLTNGKLVEHPTSMSTRRLKDLHSQVLTISLDREMRGQGRSNSDRRQHFVSP